MTETTAGIDAKNQLPSFMWNDPVFRKLLGRMTLDQADSTPGFWRKAAELMCEEKSKTESMLLDALHKKGQLQTKYIEVLKSLVYLISGEGR
jgi:hypothetical protein